MSRNTKSIGVAFEDQYLSGGEMASYTITGGTINGAAIGGTTAAAFTGTTVTAATLVVTAKATIGDATTDTVGFYGTTPAAQPASSNQGAPGATAPVSISATQWGFSTSTQALALLTLAIQLRADLVTLGIIKGSA